MCLTIAYSKIKKRNLVLISNVTHQRETLSERPIRLPIIQFNFALYIVTVSCYSTLCIVVRYGLKRKVYFKFQKLEPI